MKLKCKEVWKVLHGLGHALTLTAFDDVPEVWVWVLADAKRASLCSSW